FLYHHTSTPEIYTLSLHDALPISIVGTDIAQRRWTLTKMVTGTGTLSIEETFLGPQTLPPPPTRHALFAILIALGVLLHFGTIGIGDLYSETEGQYAAAAREMIQSDQYLLP